MALQPKLPDKISPEDIILQAIKLPGVNVNREKFLKTELMGYCSDDIVKIAIERNPAVAGVPKRCIHKLSEQVINYETSVVTTLSFAAGLPGGVAMLATVPADIVQYFGAVIRVMQKLAYLYGFPEFDCSEDNITEDTKYQIMIFLGAMFGVQEANIAINRIAGCVAEQAAKKAAEQAIKKGLASPVVQAFSKKLVQQVGIKISKQALNKVISKFVPVLGGVVSGGLSWVTFKICAIRLRNRFEKLPLCDPKHYNGGTKSV